QILANFRFPARYARSAGFEAHLRPTRQRMEARSLRCVPHVAPAAVTTSGIDAGGVPSGRVKQNRAPPPGLVSTQIFPPWASMIARLIASPRPTPGVADSREPRVNFSKIASRCPSGMPEPLSLTVTSSRPSEASAPMLMVVPGEVYLPAFSSKL